MNIFAIVTVCFRARIVQQTTLYMKWDRKIYKSKVRAIQKSSAISAFGRMLHILILLIELIPNITFLFEFDQVFEEKFSKYGEQKKIEKCASLWENLRFWLFPLILNSWIWYIRIHHQKLSLIMCFWAAKNKSPVLHNFGKSKRTTSWTAFLANLSPPWF